MKLCTFRVSGIWDFPNILCTWHFLSLQCAYDGHKIRHFLKTLPTVFILGCDFCALLFRLPGKTLVCTKKPFSGSHRTAVQLNIGWFLTGPKKFAATKEEAFSPRKLPVFEMAQNSQWETQAESCLWKLEELQYSPPTIQYLGLVSHFSTGNPIFVPVISKWRFSFYEFNLWSLRPWLQLIFPLSPQ